MLHFYNNIKKISTKLLLVFIVVSIVSSIAGVTGAVIMKTSDTRYGNALINYGFAQGDLGKLGMVLNENRAYVRDIVFLTGEKELQEAYDKVQQNAQDVNTLLETVRATTITVEGNTLLDSIEADLATYREIREQVISYGMGNDQDNAYKIWMEEASPLINNIVVNTEKLLQMKVTAGTVESEELTSTANSSLLVMVILIVMGIFLSVILALILSKSISKPIIMVQKAAAQLADGDLDIDISSNLKDEVGIMTGSFMEAVSLWKAYISDISGGLSQIADGNFNIIPKEKYKGAFVEIEQSILKIIFSLSDTLGMINQVADQVAIGSEQVALGAQTLAEGATEQASTIEELVATMNEVSEQVLANSNLAKQSSSQALKIGEKAQNSNEEMKNMLHSMTAITEASNQIALIINSIEDIASQTNLLSLNAAIEAARAGEAGKGFAVVAEEIRQLASQSALAAKNTRTLIETSIAAVSEGTEISHKTAEILQEVIRSIHETIEQMKDIANKSEQQTVSARQVDLGISQISSVIQSNSATAEESSAASEELSSQAQNMKELVGHFILKN